MMTAGPDAVALMHFYEGCKLRAYPDPATGGDPWTIGYGDTGPDVVRGLVITQAEADARFLRRLAKEFEPGVRSALKREPTQRQFDAMVSLAYNIGIGNFKLSTLVLMFNRGDAKAASAQFRRWNKAAGRPMLGLTRRRVAESIVFDGYPAALAISKAGLITKV